MTLLSREQVLDKINSFAYWHYPFDLGHDVVITPTRKEYAEKKTHLRDFIWPVVLDLFGGSLEGLRVLDLGCNAGFWSLEAHRAGAAYVLGIEARPEYVEQATFIRDTLGIEPARLDYRRMDLFDVVAADGGEFDLVLMLRVLHHLGHPVEVLESIRTLCRTCLVLDVKLVRGDDPALYISFQEEQGHLNGVNPGLRLRPTLSAIEPLLKASGFADVKRIPPIPPLEEEYFKGRRALFTARTRAAKDASR